MKATLGNYLRGEKAKGLVERHIAASMTSEYTESLGLYHTHIACKQASQPYLKLFSIQSANLAPSFTMILLESHVSFTLGRPKDICVCPISKCWGHVVPGTHWILHWTPTVPWLIPLTAVDWVLVTPVAITIICPSCIPVAFSSIACCSPSPLSSSKVKVGVEASKAVR